MNAVLNAKKVGYERYIGHYKGNEAGPTIVAIGGMHGNEHSGVIALSEVFRRLNSEQPDFKGEFIALSGNLRALESGQRFIDHDLNRMWRLTPDMKGLVEIPDIHERTEMMAIQEIVDEVVERRKGPLVFLDLHTTSSESPPFLLVGDTLRNRDFVKDLELPVILGLEEQLNGPLLSYLNASGHVSIGFEAGQHEAKISVENHTSLIWLILVKAGCLAAENLKDYEANRAWLASQTDSQHKQLFEVRYRHGIDDSHRFKMKDGYNNFQSVAKDEVLAQSKAGPVRSPESGRIFMPLYQSQGDDGFFIIRKIPTASRLFSIFLRKMKLQWLLPLFPGIKKHPDNQNLLIVHPKALRRFGPGLLYMFGYRRRSRSGEQFIFIKRHFDLKGPTSIDVFSS